MIERNPDYFLSNGVLIFFMLCTVSFLAFLIPREKDKIGERIAHGSTMLLTIVAFKWLISEKVPNLPYDTFLDDYSQWGFNITCMIMLLNGILDFIPEEYLEIY